MGFLSDIWGGITGKTQADAALRAAQIQADAAAQGQQMTQESMDRQLAAQQEALAQQQALMQPFNEFGQGFMGQTQDAVGNLQGLMSDPTSIMQNPMFQAIQEDVRRQNLQNAAAGGRLGTGGTLAGLESAALRTGFDVLNQERAAQMQNVGMLQGLVGMGQQAAGTMGQGQLSTGANLANTMFGGNQMMTDLLTSGAAAQAAGQIGAADARAQGAMNLVGLGTSLATGGLGGAVGGLGAGVLGMLQQPTMTPAGGGGSPVMNSLNLNI